MSHLSVFLILKKVIFQRRYGGLRKPRKLRQENYTMNHEPYLENYQQKGVYQCELYIYKKYKKLSFPMVYILRAHFFLYSMDYMFCFGQRVNEGVSSTSEELNTGFVDTVQYRIFFSFGLTFIVENSASKMI